LAAAVATVAVARKKKIPGFLRASVVSVRPARDPRTETEKVSTTPKPDSFLFSRATQSRGRSSSSSTVVVVIHEAEKKSQ
jgi:hypothetical protein